MPRQRGETWAHEETLLFLSFFGELEVQKRLNSCYRNQDVYEKLAERMTLHGYVRTPCQVRFKAKGLKKQYRELKKNSQSDEGRSLWRYYHIMDNIYCNDPNMGALPEAATSSTLQKDEEHTKGLESASQPAAAAAALCSDESQGRGEPACSYKASRSPSGASLAASAMSSSSTKPSSQRTVQCPSTRAALRFAKTRTRRSASVAWTTVTKVLQQCHRNNERNQQIFQEEMAMLRQEKKAMREEASRTRMEIKALASQIREVFHFHAEAINRVADAINRCSYLLESLILMPEPGPQREVNQSLQEDSSGVERAPEQGSSMPYSSLM
ncbi:zinc finger and SCAN domain-containing protein 29-like isoform X2 [Hemicordylus capensis]|nr:zinc finger and SCAN domain-containing protein 29-like isoform X2 [Hemicordylus capensis]XP_053150997.1 zinc finger and SCAN domain-containing protein 29-like isoform X2 [Hemicordylus capensis]XP_053150998.1 zinc finger and SCAN domain-containing protein 29-like isoform X2 [Hemicordylus capensis]XP_053150999.1 zinc finger and SCAN domain-containing protein 29-like isoform X2 [Hemicordylus capensis]